MKKYLSQNFRQKDFSHTDSFEVREQAAMILADPCYKEDIVSLVEQAKNTTDPVIIEKLGACFPRMKKGTYRVEIQKNSDGNRTASWICKHQETSTYVKEDSFGIPVDSGQVGLFFAQSAYQTEAIPQDNIQDKALEMGWSNQHHPWYVYMCATSLGYFHTNAMGICTDSGYGDGWYEAYAYFNDDNEVVAIEILFIEESDDDEENDW